MSKHFDLTSMTEVAARTFYEVNTNVGADLGNGDKIPAWDEVHPVTKQNIKQNLVLLVQAVAQDAERQIALRESFDAAADEAVDLANSALPRLPITVTPAAAGEPNGALQVVATYQMLGDLPGHEWAEMQFTWAKEQGLIRDYQVLGVWPGGFVEQILFIVDIPFGDGENEAPTGMDWTKAREFAMNRLNGPIIQDSDVEVCIVAGVV